MSEDKDYPVARARMVEEEVRAKGVADPRVLDAMRTVPRHGFVPRGMEHAAYGPSALPIGSGQTISAPHMVGIMTEALRVSPGDKVLEIGTGSGYQAAILGRITRRVVTVERFPDLAEQARTNLAGIGMDWVIVKVGDGTLGYPEMAPYDRIIVTAGGPHVPPALVEQLVDGGILLMPVGDRDTQVLRRYTWNGSTLEEETLGRCIFVPLVGREGFPGGGR